MSVSSVKRENLLASPERAGDLVAVRLGEFDVELAHFGPRLARTAS
jgi:hypothetical protein